jgi:uncharacterized protein YuzE
MTPFTFGLAVETDDATGEILAVYFQIRRGKVHETREFADGVVLADYNRKGELIGIELLAPCRATIVDQLAANEPAAIRRETKQFMKDAGPRKMVLA